MADDRSGHEDFGGTETGEEFESGLASMHGLARKLTTDDFLRESPPPELWARIAQAADTDAAPRRSGWAGSSNRFLSVAAAAVLLVALGAFGFAVLRGDSAPEVAGETMLVNDGLPVVTDATADVELLVVDGEYQLEIDLSQVPDPGDDRLELWIIDENVEGMFSLGFVEADGRYAVPDGVDPAEFPIVDISVEPLDGDPTHSGQSVLRGVLDVTQG